MGDRDRERGQTIVIAAVGMSVVTLVLLLVVNLGGVMLTLGSVDNTLRDAARAGALGGAEERKGGVYLRKQDAMETAQTAFDTGAAQMSGWLAYDPPLAVQVINPPDGGCASFGGGGTCYRRPAIYLRSRITINVLLGAWLPVSFDLETVVVAGVGHPAIVSTPEPLETPIPIPTEIIP